MFSLRRHRQTFGEQSEFARNKKRHLELSALFGSVDLNQMNQREVQRVSGRNETIDSESEELIEESLIGSSQAAQAVHRGVFEDPEHNIPIFIFPKRAAMPPRQSGIKYAFAQ